MQRTDKIMMTILLLSVALAVAAFCITFTREILPDNAALALQMQDSPHRMVRP